MNAELAMRTVEALEPYARRLLETAEKRGESYVSKWFLAIQQATLVCRAYDAAPDKLALHIVAQYGAGRAEYCETNFRQ